MKTRANWPELKSWLSKSALRFACVERGTGLYVNCDSKEELHITLMASPSIRADYKKAMQNIELYKGPGILAIDGTAARRLSKRIKNLRRKDGLKNVRLYRDAQGGLVIAGERIELDPANAMEDYSKWLENKTDGIELTGDEERGTSESVPGRDEVPGEVQRETRHSDDGVRPDEGLDQPDNG